MNLDLSPDYFDHPKTLHLKELLDCEEADVYPPRLWAWAMKFAKSGTIPGGAATIKRACKYTGNAQKLCDALMSAPEDFKHGFLEPGFKIHNWMDRTGGALKAYDKKKKRQRARRLEAVGGKNSGTIPAPRPALPGPSPPGPPPPLPGNNGLGGEQLSEEERRERFDAFDQILKPHPRERRGNLDAALIVWMDADFGTLAIDDARDNCLKATDRELKTKKWKMEKGRYIPTLANWLKSKPWIAPEIVPKDKLHLTDLRPPPELRCSDCGGHGRDETGKCGKCAGTGVDESKRVKPETIKEGRGQLFKLEEEVRATEDIEDMNF